MSKAGMTAILLFGAVATAEAAPQCYRANEIEAEQSVRYQAKLMVLSDMCRSDAYASFVHRNSAAIIGYQHQLIGYFRRTDGKKAEDSFDRYQTRLANQFALEAGHETLDKLCPRSADFLNRAPAFSKDECSRFVTEMAASERRNYVVCTDEAQAQR
jgi:hypothetical protein